MQNEKHFPQHYKNYSYILDLSNFYKNSSGQLPNSTISSISE